MCGMWLGVDDLRMNTKKSAQIMLIIWGSIIQHKLGDVYYHLVSIRIFFTLIMHKILI